MVPDDNFREIKMIILTTAILFHVCAKHGMIWEGVAAAWIFAVFVDAALYAWISYCIFKPPLS